MINWFAVGLLLILFVTPESKAADRQAIPSQEAQRSARELVEATFGESFKQGTTRGKKSGAARAMMREAAAENTSPAGSYVLLLSAIEVTPLLPTAMRAIDQLDQRFQVKAFQMKASTLWRFSMAASTPVENKSVAEYAADLMQEAVMLDDYRAARILGPLALEAAKQSEDDELLQTVQVKAEQVEKYQKEFAAVQLAESVLADVPADKAANTTVGRYRSLVNGKWRVGLALLAQGKEGTLKNLATQEMALPTDSLEQVELADQWYQLAETLSGIEQKNAMRRAGFWYRRANSGKPKFSRLQQLKVTKRIDQTPDSPHMQAAVEPSTSVEQGINYLVKQQQPNGSWSFQTGPDAGSLRCDLAATSLVLLVLLREGHTHEAGRYKETVEKGLQYLGQQGKMTPEGLSYYVSGGTSYAHGITAMTLCEAYARTQDQKLRKPAQLALKYTMFAQDPVGGGWRYQPRQAGDTSVTGWQLQSLLLGKEAGLNVADRTFSQVEKFLDSVQTNEGSKYGYATPGGGQATTAIGLWSRLQLGTDKNNAALKTGVGYIIQTGPSKGNFYFNYYAAQLAKAHDGEQWEPFLANLKTTIVAQQTQETEDSVSWHMRGGGHAAERMGRLGITAFTVMTLQMIE